MLGWKDILFVPVVMICALGGTVGLIKLINKFFLRKNDSSKSEGKE